MSENKILDTMWDDKQVYFTIINITARFNFTVGDKIFETIGIPLIYKIVTVGSVTFYIIQDFGTFCITCRQMIRSFTNRSSDIVGFYGNYRD